MTYTLTDDDLQMLRGVGNRRNKACAQLKNLSVSEKWLRNGFVGAAAEYATGLLLKQPWNREFYEKKQPADLGETIEVRSTEFLNGKLIVRDRDPEDHVYVLAIVRGRKISLVGWMEGVDAKQDVYRKDPGNKGLPIFLVPQQKLIPMEKFSLVPVASW